MDQLKPKVDSTDPGGFKVSVAIKDPDDRGRCLIPGCVLHGTVSVTASPQRGCSGDGGCVWRVGHLRIQLEGVEQHSISKSGFRAVASPNRHGEGASSAKTDGDVGVPVLHLWRKLTLVGERERSEIEEEQMQMARERRFVQTNSRGAPLSGVVLGVHGDGGAADGGAAPGESPVPETRPADGVDTIGYEGSLPKRTLLIRPGDTQSVHFAVKLPPWLPPSFFYHTDATARGSIKYTVTAILDADLVRESESASVSPASLRHGDWESEAAPLILRAAVPRRQVLQCYERSGMKPAFTQTWRFRVRSQNVLTQLLNAGKVTVGAVEVVVKYLSSTALLLTDPDDASSLALCKRWTSALTGLANNDTPSTRNSSANAPGFGVDTTGAPVLGSVVSGGYRSGASYSRAALASSSMSSQPSSPAKLKTSSRSSLRPQSLPVPVGKLSLGVRIANGSPYDTEKTLKKLPDVTCVRVELMEQIILHSTPPSSNTGRSFQSSDENVLYRSEPIRLGYQDCRQTIKPGASQNFAVVITLPPRFRRTRQMRRWKARSESPEGSDSEEARSLVMGETEKNAASPGYSYGGSEHPPPPSSITTSHFTSVTYLRVSLPSLPVIPEIEPDARNIIVLAEAVDESDAVPYLPMVVSA